MRKLTLAVIFIVIGIIIGISPFGEKIDDFYYKNKYKKVLIAEGFTKTPFVLKIHYVLNNNKKIETHLINKNSGDKLPILEVNGLIQVGDFNYRLSGLKDQAEADFLTAIGKMKSKLIKQLQKTLEKLK